MGIKPSIYDMTETHVQYLCPWFIHMVWQSSAVVSLVS